MIALHPHTCVFSDRGFLQVTCYMLNVSEAKSHIIQATRAGEDSAVSDSMFKNNF